MPRVNNFPNDGKTWRVDWFGGIMRTIDVPSDPLMEVIMSPLFDPDGEITAQWNIDSDNQKIFLVPIGLLPMISCGSVWKNGREIRRTDIKKEEFPDLIISQATVQEIHSDFKIDGKTLIPATHHIIGRGSGKATAYQARCLCIENKGDPFGIIIPIIEIIRFYYAVTTRMAQAVVNHDFQLNLDALVNPVDCDYNPETRIAHITLRKEIRDFDAWVIARILYSEVAARGTRMIGDSLIQESFSGKQPLHPRSIFPFEGTTRLKVRGKWIPQVETTKRWRYLVFSILTCSGPFPYEEIIRDRDNANIQADPETDIPEDEKLIAFPFANAPKINENGNSNIQSEEEPFKGIEEAYIGNFDINRFDYLIGKELITKTPNQNFFKSGGWKSFYSIETTFFGTGQGTTTPSNIAPIRIIAGQPVKENCTVNVMDFMSIIEEMNNINGVEVVMRQATNQLMYVPLSRPTNKKQWSYLDSKKRIRRRLFIADVLIANQYVTLIDFEWREGQPYKLALFRECTGCQLTNNQLYHLLNKMVYHEGIWDKMTPPSSIQMITRKHTWGDNKTTAANKIMKEIITIYLLNS